MARDETIRQGMRRLRQSVEQAVRSARSGNVGRVNVVRRTNIVAGVNRGSDGAVRRASATQHTEIRQGDGSAS